MHIFTMNFEMPHLNMSTIQAIRRGLRTATSRASREEIERIKSIKVNDVVEFRKYNRGAVIDKIYVFAQPHLFNPNAVGIQLDNNLIECSQKLQQWCALEAWDYVFAKKWFENNKNRDIWQFTYSLYPLWKDKYINNNISSLADNEVFVFGSNTEGRHGAGAAKTALNKFGAKWGSSSGLQGQSYALITTDLNINKRPSITYARLVEEVNKFTDFAISNPQYTFLVTEVGCGLAGFTVEQVAPLFTKAAALNNVKLPAKFIREIVLAGLDLIINKKL